MITTSRSRRLPPSSPAASRSTRVGRCRRTQANASLLTLLARLPPVALAQDKETISRLEGIVFVGNSGDPSYTAVGKVLKRPMTRQKSRDDGEQEFLFRRGEFRLQERDVRNGAENSLRQDAARHALG